MFPNNASPIRRDQRPEFSFKEQFLVFCNWRFCLFLINNFLFSLGAVIVFVFLADYGEHKNLTEFQSVQLISVIGVSNAIGRLLNILLILCHCNYSYAYIISCTLSGVAVCLMNLEPHKAEFQFLILVITCSFYGALLGIQIGNLAVITSYLTPENQLTTAYGLVMFFGGLGTIAGPPVAGEM